MENITINEAFAHVAKSPAYWVWLIVAFVFCVGVIYKAAKGYINGDVEGRQVAFYGIIAIAIFMFAALFRPCEIAANTTKEQAARGVYIGY